MSTRCGAMPCGARRTRALLVRMKACARRSLLIDKTRPSQKTRRSTMARIRRASDDARVLRGQPVRSMRATSASATLSAVRRIAKRTSSTVGAAACHSASRGATRYHEKKLAATVTTRNPTIRAKKRRFGAAASGVAWPSQSRHSSPSFGLRSPSIGFASACTAPSS